MESSCKHIKERVRSCKKYLDVAISSEYSLNDLQSPLSMERPCARNEGCSGLQKPNEKQN